MADVTNGQLYALGAVGNALNAYESSRASMDMWARQTDQIRQRVAFEKQTLAKQIAIRDQEIARQQQMARAVADSVNASKAQYGNVEADIGAKSAAIADVFKSALAHQSGSVAVPKAVGPVADREASASAAASGDATRNAENLAKTQALGQVFIDKNQAQIRNKQVAGMLQNFAQGSSNVANQEIQAPAGKFFETQQIKPANPTMGDLFYGLSMGGLAYMNQPKDKPTTGSDSIYALPTVSSSGGIGLRAPGTSLNSLGIK
jgi:hypothetical protein